MTDRSRNFFVGLTFLAALGVGLCFGLANGVLIAVFDIPPFITTLGTLGIAQGLYSAFHCIKQGRVGWPQV